MERALRPAMPSPAHETLVEFLRTQPAWLDALLRELGAPGLSRGLRAVDPAVRVVDPSTVATYVLLRDEEKPSWLVVEVQRGDDPEKRRRWIFVAAMLRNLSTSLRQSAGFICEPFVGLLPRLTLPVLVAA